MPTSESASHSRRSKSKKKKKKAGESVDTQASNISKSSLENAKPPLPPDPAVAEHNQPTTSQSDDSTLPIGINDDNWRSYLVEIMGELERTKRKLSQFVATSEDSTSPRQNELDALKAFHRAVVLATMTAKRESDSPKAELVNQLEIAMKEHHQNKKKRTHSRADVLSKVQAKLQHLRADKTRLANQVYTKKKMEALNLSPHKVEVASASTNAEPARAVLREGYE